MLFFILQTRQANGCNKLKRLGIFGMYPDDVQIVQSEFEKQMEWTPGQGIEEDNEDSKEEEKSKKEAKSLIASYNEAMDNLSVQTKIGNVSPLTFQLKSTWDETTEDEKEVCIEKAMKGCSIVC